MYHIFHITEMQGLVVMFALKHGAAFYLLWYEYHLSFSQLHGKWCGLHRTFKQYWAFHSFRAPSDLCCLCTTVCIAQTSDGDLWHSWQIYAWLQLYNVSLFCGFILPFLQRRNVGPAECYYAYPPECLAYIRALLPQNVKGELREGAYPVSVKVFSDCVLGWKFWFSITWLFYLYL